MKEVREDNIMEQKETQGRGKTAPARRNSRVGTAPPTPSRPIEQIQAEAAAKVREKIVNDKATIMVKKQRDSLRTMANFSAATGVPSVFPNLTVGGDTTVAVFRAAGLLAGERPKAVVNVFVQGIGPEEAEGILAVEAFLIAMYEGKSAKEGIVAAGLADKPESVTRGHLMALLYTIGKLPELSRLILGRDDVPEIYRESGSSKK